MAWIVLALRAEVVAERHLFVYRMGVDCKALSKSATSAKSCDQTNARLVVRGIRQRKWFYRFQITSGECRGCRKVRSVSVKEIFVEFFEASTLARMQLDGS